MPITPGAVCVPDLHPDLPVYGQIRIDVDRLIRKPLNRKLDGFAQCIPLNDVYAVQHKMTDTRRHLVACLLNGAAQPVPRLLTRGMYAHRTHRSGKTEGQLPADS
ncbi:hypothetical protein D3C78_1684890 [compost metagenome]